MTMDETKQGGGRSGDSEQRRLTIVGGRRLEDTEAAPLIPVGVEVLVRKAAVDPAFRAILLDDWREAARRIRLPLEPEERAMLDVISAPELEAFLGRLEIPESASGLFLGEDGPAMCRCLVEKAIRDAGPGFVSRGIRPGETPNGLGRASSPDPGFDPGRPDVENSGAGNPSEKRRSQRRRKNSR